MKYAYNEMYLEDAMENMGEMVDYYNALANADLSNWYQEYNGQAIHRIPSEHDGGLTVNHDVIYHAAGEGADVQAVLKKMIEAMILPRMEASDDRNYTITKYRLVDQPVIQIADNIWLVEHLRGYYAYEGFEGCATMEERLEYEEAISDGMLEFSIDGGDTSEFFYLLIEENGVYRLQYGVYLDDAEADNDSVPTAKNYQEAYTQIINEWIAENPDDADELKCSLVYFDEDDVPELVVKECIGVISMYTYYDGQVHLVMDEWGIGGGSIGYYYLPKANVMYNHDADMAGAQNWVYFGKMDENHEIVSYHDESLRYQYVTDMDGDGEARYDEWDGNTYFFYGEESISEEKFNSYMIGGTYEDLKESVVLPGYQDLYPNHTAEEILTQLR